MPDTNEIKPALTKEQWAEGKVVTDEATIRLAGVNRDELIIATDFVPLRTAVGLAATNLHQRTDFPEAELSPRSAPALMALANAALPDDDPRKITRADVALLSEYHEGAADQYEYTAQRCEEDGAHADAVGWRTSANLCRALAAKLAALLPPAE